MIEFIDKDRNTIEVFSNDQIWSTFKEEYSKSPYTWRGFIKSKDLGILVKESIFGDKFYTIIDEARWNYNKIKYEFH